MASVRPSIVIAVSLAAISGCKDPKGGEIVVRPAQVVPTTTPLAQNEPFIMDRRHREDEIADLVKGKDGKKVKDEQKGDKQDQEWIPKEHVTGASRWKDTGIYVDGKPIGFLSWGELPLDLKPTWIKDKVSANKRPGTNDLGWRWARQRFYKFKDYFAAVGIDVRQIKELHIYGPKFTQTNISTGEDLLGPQGDGLMFRFGSNVGGKAISQIPEGYGNGKTPDKIAGVMVYLKREPPKMVQHEGLFLDGVLQVGVPYYGEPIRGGIRVYVDNKLATIIKRQELDPKVAQKNADNELEWPLLAMIDEKVAQEKIVEVWAIHNERRVHKWPGSAIASMRFLAESQAKTKGGGIVVKADGFEPVRAAHLALHTRPVKELPVITPDDD